MAMVLIISILLVTTMILIYDDRGGDYDEHNCEYDDAADDADDGDDDGDDDDYHGDDPLDDDAD
eukprot:3247010-Karenia_brevis.AAC.1